MASPLPSFLSGRGPWDIAYDLCFIISHTTQDYNYLRSNAFEITVELSCCKYPPASSLGNEWLNNKQSLLAYLEKVIVDAFHNDQRDSAVCLFIYISIRSHIYLLIIYIYILTYLGAYLPLELPDYAGAYGSTRNRPGQPNRCWSPRGSHYRYTAAVACVVWPLRGCLLIIIYHNSTSTGCVSHYHCYYTMHHDKQKCLIPLFPLRSYISQWRIVTTSCIASSSGTTGGCWFPATTPSPPLPPAISHRFDSMIVCMSGVNLWFFLFFNTNDLFNTNDISKHARYICL